MTGEVREAVRQLAAFVAEGVSPPAVVFERATMLIADTLGVGIRGATVPTSEALRLGVPPGPAELFGPASESASVEEAAFCNAVAICSMELDEGIRPTGHPAMHILPPLLAVAQAEDRSGAEFVRAFILGYEVQARLQRAAPLRPPVHCHGTYGNVGVAAALAALGGWDAERTVALLHAAATSAAAASYSLPYAGATIHAATPALSGAAALRAARLVAAGFTAWEGSIEEVFGSILGTGMQAEPLTADLGSDWAVESAYVKFHGTCGHAHSALDALADALGAGATPGTLAAPAAIDEIAEIVVELPERACELSGTEVTTALGARFSVPLSIAAFLRHGDTSPAAFDGVALADPALSALARRVRLVPRPEFDADFLVHHRARVLLRWQDGSQVEGRCDNPYGNAMNPAGIDDVRAKFERNVHGAAPQADTSSGWATVRGLPARESMRGLCGQIVSSRSAR